MPNGMTKIQRKYCEAIVTTTLVTTKCLLINCNNCILFFIYILYQKLKSFLHH